ncbi:MAG: hypothetical protein IPM24_01320 [Bryobacterales bacterium]|nr:hypothetical protein [Bryobacterales bacterium]
MKSSLFVFFAVAVGLSTLACQRATETPEAIRAAVIDAVQGRVNLDQMDVEVQSVNFKGEEAEAMVDFRPKGSAPGTGIVMKYVLEQKDGKWTVKNRTEGGNPHSEGGVMGAPQEPMRDGDLPPGHPPMGRERKE